MFAVMQPYFFPYVGFYQLIEKVESFVFYDTVSYIKSGWINRNRLIINKSVNYFTVPLQNASSNLNIREVKAQANPKWRDKMLKTIIQNYSKAPFAEEVIPLIEEVLAVESDDIADLAQASAEVVLNHLGIEKKLLASSAMDLDESSYSEDNARSDRLIAIAEEFNDKLFLNNASGSHLYNSEYFTERGVQLCWFTPEVKAYPQFNSNEFEPGLSILDMLMNIPKEKVLEHIKGGIVVNA